MRASTDGHPEVGASARTLGVRPSDVPVINGQVQPETGGMTANPSLAQIAPQWVPKRLAHLRLGAEGPNNNQVWCHGSGPFVHAPIAPHLLLRPDRPGHGNVEPAQAMSFDAYQAAIHATRLEWRVDEV